MRMYHYTYPSPFSLKNSCIPDGSYNWVKILFWAGIYIFSKYVLLIFGFFCNKLMSSFCWLLSYPFDRMEPILVCFECIIYLLSLIYNDRKLLTYHNLLSGMSTSTIRFEIILIQEIRTGFLVMVRHRRYFGIYCCCNFLIIFDN